jgi:hypothetical protein
MQNLDLKIKPQPKMLTKKCTYTIEFTETEEGTQLRRVNDGFNPFELLGIIAIIKDELVEQMKGHMKPDVIKREVVEPEKKPSNICQYKGCENHQAIGHYCENHWSILTNR